jgi:hypothetical protein
MMSGLSFATKRKLVIQRRAVRAMFKAARQEAEELTAAGYRRHETDWEIHRGGRMGDAIVDAKISVCGKYVWTKLGPDPKDPYKPASTGCADKARDAA